MKTKVINLIANIINATGAATCILCFMWVLSGCSQNGNLSDIGISMGGPNILDTVCQIDLESIENYKIERCAINDGNYTHLTCDTILIQDTYKKSN